MCFSQRRVQRCRLKNYCFEAKKRNSLANAFPGFIDNFVVLVNHVTVVYLCDGKFKSFRTFTTVHLSINVSFLLTQLIYCIFAHINNVFKLMYLTSVMIVFLYK